MIDITEFITRSREERRAHLRLDEPCCERGGNSTNHKGVLAQYLDTTIPSGRTLLCHACNNGKCSNPKHLYWGTDKENTVIDGTEFGSWKSMWQRTVEKYGYEKACEMNSRKMRNNKNGSGNRGKAKSEDHKKKISDAVKKSFLSREKKDRPNSGRKPKVPYNETYEVWSRLGVVAGAKHFGISVSAFKSRVILAKTKIMM